MSTPSEQRPESKPQASTSALRQVLIASPMQGRGSKPLPNPQDGARKRQRPAAMEIPTELIQWQVRREAFSPLLVRVAKSSMPPEEKDEFHRELAAAEDLSLAPDLQPADFQKLVQTLDELEARITRALEKAESAPDGKKRGDKKQRNKAAIEQQRAEKELLVEAALMSLTGSIDLAVPRAILARHKVCVPNEERVLDEFESLEDLLNDKALKADPDLMKEKLTAIGAAMSAAFGRQKEMSVAISKIPKPKKTVDAGLGYQDDEIRAYQEITRISGGMIDHVPASWIAQWTPNFSARIANLTATDDEKRANLAEAKKGFSDQTIAEHKKAMGNAIGSNSTRKLDRVEFFYDRMTKAATLQELQGLAKMQDEVIAVGTKILDSGGKLSDVRKALAHIPEAWWPPQFIDYLQAWRKTEREMVRIAVAKAFEKADKADTALDTADGVLSFVGFLASTGSTIAKVGGSTGGGGDASPAWTEATEVQKAIGVFLKEIQEALQLGRDGVSAMDKEFFVRENTVLEFFKSPEKMEEVAARLLEVTSTQASAVYTAGKNVGGLAGVPDTAVLMTSVLPGIALASASIDLYLAIRSLLKHARTLGSTKQLVKDAELDLVLERDEDGGAFVRALGNEVEARKLQLKKDSVDVTVKGIGVGSATAYTVGGHVGAGVGLGLTVTGKVISYGGKVVFANIEWSQANIAKKLIQEARAGSPSARIELMSECGLYAKMYIAILAREGHKKATEFIVDRGIEESDLEGGALSLKIVVEEMLKDADQVDETKVEDSLLLANISGVGGKGAISFARKVGKTGKSVGEWIEGKLDANRETPYDDTWKHSPDLVALSASAWSAAKAEAKKAGLLDAPSGVSDDLKVLEAAYVSLQQAEKPEDVKACTEGVLNGLDALYITLMEYEPLTNPQGPKLKVELHRGMYEYVSAMKTKVSTEQGKFDAALIASGHKITDWSTNDTNPDPAQWKANFTDCATKSYLSQDDCGVGKALVAFKAAETSPDLAVDADKQKRRKALIAAYDAGTAVLGALDVLFGSCRECQGLRVYIDNIKRTVAARMRYWDKESVTVVGEDWKLPVQSDVFTAKAWDTCWTRAVQDGMATAELKDGGLHLYLVKAEAAALALGNEQDARQQRKSRQALQQALASVFGAARACAATHKSSPAAFTQYAAAYAKWAQGEIQKVRDVQANVTFDVSDQAFNEESFARIEERAKEAGAVGSSDGTMKKVKQALSKFAAAEDAFQKAEGKQNHKARRKAAQERDSALLEVVTAAVGALSVEGYADNTQMREYLEHVKNEALQRQQVARYKSILDGSAASFGNFDPGACTPDKAGWEKLKKAAVEAGLLADAQTGFGAALESASATYKSWQEAKEADKFKKAESASVPLSVAEKLAEQLGKQTANKTILDFFAAVISDLRAKQADMLTDRTTAFKPAAFTPWSNSAWQKVKAEAVVRGLLKKDEKTGLTDILSEAKKALAAWHKLGDAEKMAQSESARKPLIKVREIATTYRDATTDQGLKGYFQQMVAAASGQINELQQDLVGGKDLRLPTFEWSQKSWQTAKKAAVKAGVFQQDKTTGFGAALEESQKAFDEFRKAQGKTDKQAMATARTKAADAVTKTRQIAAAMGGAGQTHPALKAYFDSAVDAADGRLRQLTQDDVPFNPPQFDWTNSVDWENTRKEAVKLGLLDKSASAMFGDELKDASHKYVAFGNILKEVGEAARETDPTVKQQKLARLQARKSAAQDLARNAINKARQTAAALKQQTQHSSLQAYFSQCLAKADEWLKVLEM